MHDGASRQWRSTTLGAVTSWMSGGTPSKGNPDYWGGQIPWVSAKSMKCFYLDDSEDHVTDTAIADGARLVEPGDILLLVRGMTLHNDVPLGIAMRPMTFNQDVKGIRGANGAETLFIAYWLLANKIQLLAAVDQASHGTGRLRTDVLHAMELQLPPTAEQLDIAGVLSSLDDKIEQIGRTAAKLEELARAIFRAWFVDFEPVKAKANGATSFPSMPQPVFESLPSVFHDTELGPAPEGWTCGQIACFACLSRDQVKPHQHPEEVFEHFSIPAFDAGQRPVVEPGHAIKSNKSLVVEGCVMLSKLNPRIPRVWLPMAASGRRQIASTEFLVLVPDATRDRHYLYCQLQQSTFRDELIQGVSGTSNSHQRLQPRDVLEKAIIFPEVTVRNAFTEIADPLFAHIAAGHLEARKLAELRDYLLPKLFSGEVRVRDAERAVENA